jgi:hypothetical protein
MDMKKSPGWLLVSSIVFLITTVVDIHFHRLHNTGNNRTDFKIIDILVPIGIAAIVIMAIINALKKNTK